MLKHTVRLRRANNNVFNYGACRVFFGDREGYQHDVHGSVYSAFLAAVGEFERLSHLVNHCRFDDEVIAADGVCKHIYNYNQYIFDKYIKWCVDGLHKVPVHGLNSRHGDHLAQPFE
jgi:hypothetical protein